MSSSDRPPPPWRRRSKDDSRKNCRPPRRHRSQRCAKVHQPRRAARSGPHSTSAATAMETETQRRRPAWPLRLQRHRPPPRRLPRRRPARWRRRHLRLPQHPADWRPPCRDRGRVPRPRCVPDPDRRPSRPLPLGRPDSARPPVSVTCPASERRRASAKRRANVTPVSDRRPDSATTYRPSARRRAATRPATARRRRRLRVPVRVQAPPGDFPVPRLAHGVRRARATTPSRPPRAWAGLPHRGPARSDPALSVPLLIPRVRAVLARR